MRDEGVHFGKEFVEMSWMRDPSPMAQLAISGGGRTTEERLTDDKTRKLLNGGIRLRMDSGAEMWVGYEKRMWVDSGA